MKRFTSLTNKIAFILLVLFSYASFGQMAVPEKKNQNHLELELNYLSVSAYYNRLISDKFSLSFGGGVGSSLNFILIQYDDYPTVLGDYLSIRNNVNYEPIKNLNISLGIQGSFAGFGDNDICEECGLIYFGLPVSLSYGLKYIRIGTRIIPTRFKVGNTDRHFNILLNPVFIKIVI